MPLLQEQIIAVPYRTFGMHIRICPRTIFADNFVIGRNNPGEPAINWECHGYLVRLTTKIAYSKPAPKP